MGLGHIRKSVLLGTLADMKKVDSWNSQLLHFLLPITYQDLLNW